MTRMTTKTVFSLGFMAAALSLAGCSSEYHDARDPYMELSTPSAVLAVPPMVDQPPAAALQDSNADLGLVPMHVGPSPAMSPILSPIEKPALIESPSAPQTGPDVQILGQPGAGPSILDPAAEAMPDMRPAMEDSYPVSR